MQQDEAKFLGRHRLRLVGAVLLQCTSENSRIFASGLGRFRCAIRRAHRKLSRFGRKVPDNFVLQKKNLLLQNCWGKSFGTNAELQRDNGTPNGSDGTWNPNFILGNLKISSSTVKNHVFHLNVRRQIWTRERSSNKSQPINL